MELQTTFYVLGIIFMALMLVLIFALLIAVLVIKRKINHVHDVIEAKVNTVKDVADKVATGLRTVKNFVKR